MLSSGAQPPAWPYMQVSSFMQSILHSRGAQIWTVGGLLARLLPHRALPSMASRWLRSTVIRFPANWCPSAERREYCRPVAPPTGLTICSLRLRRSGHQSGRSVTTPSQGSGGILCPREIMLRRIEFASSWARCVAKISSASPHLPSINISTARA